MRNIFLSIFLFSLLSLANSQNSDIETKLFELPDVIFKPIDVPEGFRAAYELRIKQSIDHESPSGGYFYQRAFLSHKGFDRPTVMITEGYEQSRNRVSELSRLIDANQIVIEHRYFGQSIPDEIDYNYLNLKQATSDLHAINTIFKKIYSGKWLSTGISKGGQTTIYYRYFYPNDVNVSISYVAPFNLEYEEQRIYDFLDTIGSDTCREKLKKIQIRALKNREEAINYLRWYSYGAGLTFTYLTLEEAFEYTVLEYPFSFWQWGYDCLDIPGDSASLEEVLVHIINISNIDFFSDRDMEKYASHYYQAATEMGYYGYDTEELKDYLKVLPIKPHPHAAFVPNKLNVEFDGALANNTYKWLQAHGDRFVYIYGGSDTWTATAILPNEQRDALWFFLNGKDHAGARIRNMSEQDQQKLISTLERWLEMEIEPHSFFSWPK